LQLDHVSVSSNNGRQSALSALDFWNKVPNPNIPTEYGKGEKAGRV
jgi:hypothetical protein